MKKNKPKPKKKAEIRVYNFGVGELADLITGAMEQVINRHPAFIQTKQYMAVEDSAAYRPIHPARKRTPVRDYLRLIAIVLVVALGAHFAIKKMSGPPKGALYQISSGPGRTWTDYASAKPTLTASGCVVWFDLEGLGNIFCGEFVISDVPGRVVHE